MKADGIRRLRLELGLTQEQLSRELGVSVRSVARWETANGTPGPLATRALRELRDDLPIEAKRVLGVFLVRGLLKPGSSLLEREILGALGHPRTASHGRIELRKRGLVITTGEEVVLSQEGSMCLTRFGSATRPE